MTDLGPVTEARISAAFESAAMITAKAAAGVLGLDVRTLRSLTRRGAVRAIGDADARYAEAELRRYLTEGPPPTCRSTSLPRAASGNMTSSIVAVDFTAPRASKPAARRRK